jgi:hypothetical protein
VHKLFKIRQGPFLGVLNWRIVYHRSEPSPSLMKAPEVFLRRDHGDLRELDDHVLSGLRLKFVP